VDARSSAEVVFFAALEKAGPAERAAYLDDACDGDEALRRRVEALLAAHVQVGEFLERPVVEAEGLAALAGPDLSFLAPSTEPGSLGRLDHYEVLEVIGRGGTGIVLRARDSKLLRAVALKVLAGPQAASGAARYRFAREARATAAIRDEHVIHIYAVRDDAPVPYLVMEYIDGCNLEALLRKGGPPEVKDVLRIGIQVARGLAAAHQHGLIHRDVKPANILLENGVQRVKLTDFGLAHAADEDSLTGSGFIAGTPAYMSPEQANGKRVDHRSDLFSLGSVLYTLSTGQPPFRGRTTIEVVQAVREETPRPAREVNPDVPEPLSELIARLHANDPADRPASAAEVADLLTRLLAGLNGGSPRPPDETAVQQGPARPSGTGLRRWPRAAAALALLVAGLGLGEATGVTDVRGTVIRLFFPEGTLVVEVDDSGVSVTVDGGDVVITGAGAREIRLKPGRYKVEASKGGKVVRQELVTVHRDGRQVVRISREPGPPRGASPADAAWQKSVAALPAELQAEAVIRRLRERNPRFTHPVEPTIRDGLVTGLRFSTDLLSDLSPVRALARLEDLECLGSSERRGEVTDLSPLRGLSLKSLIVSDNHVADLSPLRDMPLEILAFRFNHGAKDLTPLKGLPLQYLDCMHTSVADLSPLKGMKLTKLWCDQSPVSDLTPLRGMALKELRVPFTKVSDLAPLRGMPLEVLVLRQSPVSDLSPLRGMTLRELDAHVEQDCDLSPLKGMPLTKLWLRFRPDRDAEIVRSLTTLQMINDRPAADFWKEVSGN
jgi:tRNA A-37 threonylcarbamoyl transferase component Bud32